MEIGSSKTSINSFIGPTSGMFHEPKTAGAGVSGGPSFMDALRDTFARETGKLTAINLPDDKGTQVLTANPGRTSTVV